MKKTLVLNKLICLGFIMYYLILLVERLLAVFLSYNNGDVYALNNGSPWAITFYVIVCVSLIAGTILFIKPFKEMFKTLCKKELFDYKKNAGSLACASVVFLFSGMMHTGFTLSAVQFVSYGFLILSMICITIEASTDKQIKGISIISLIYLVCMSMAIPVCYMTNLTGNKANMFYVSELVAVVALILAFGILFRFFMERGYTSPKIVFPLVVVVLDAIVIWLKWEDEINWFVLIFVACTFVMYLVYITYVLACAKTNE